MSFRFFLALALIVAAAFPAHAKTAQADHDADHTFFHNKVLPILQAQCLNCHSHASGKMKAGLTLDSKSGWVVGGDSGPAIVPGKPDESLLIEDLKKRGLFEDTLLIWTTEFGRTPFTQGKDGRDHNGGTFVTWMAGAGIKAGASFGQSDDWGFKTAEGKTYCYDLHATILHLMGIDHEKLTVRQNGIDRRLTDVHGHVVNEILA